MYEQEQSEQCKALCPAVSQFSVCRPCSLIAQQHFSINFTEWMFAVEVRPVSLLLSFTARVPAKGAPSRVTQAEPITGGVGRHLEATDSVTAGRYIK